jgi:hypothetical protein
LSDAAIASCFIKFPFMIGQRISGPRPLVLAMTEQNATL